MITYNIGVNSFVMKLKDPELGYELTYHPEQLPENVEIIIDPMYKNKTVTANNKVDMELVLETKKQMGSKPVVAVVHVSKPMVFSEFEQAADAILVHMGVQDQALLDLLSGAVEPSGLLPFQMPLDMMTVEEQKEDVPRDMTPYTDSEGNSYDFAYGLNWSGVIDDARVARYK